MLFSCYWYSVRQLCSSAPRRYVCPSDYTHWLRTNGVNTNGAAAKIIHLTDWGKKVRPGTFEKIPSRLTGVPHLSLYIYIYIYIKAQVDDSSLYARLLNAPMHYLSLYAIYRSLCQKARNSQRPCYIVLTPFVPFRRPISRFFAFRVNYCYAFFFLKNAIFMFSFRRPVVQAGDLERRDHGRGHVPEVGHGELVAFESLSLSLYI